MHGDLGLRSQNNSVLRWGRERWVWKHLRCLRIWRQHCISQSGKRGRCILVSSPQYVLCCPCKQYRYCRALLTEKGASRDLDSHCLCAAAGSRRKRAPKTGNASQLIKRASSGFGVEATVFPNMNKHVDVKMQMLHKIVKKRRKKEKAVN